MFKDTVWWRLDACIDKKKFKSNKKKPTNCEQHTQKKKKVVYCFLFMSAKSKSWKLQNEMLIGCNAMARKEEEEWGWPKMCV